MTKKGVVHDNQFGIIPRDIAYAQISVTAKGVYMVLAQFNQAFPSHRFIAEALGVSVSTVQRAIRQLIEAGFVRVEERRGEDGSRTSNLYHLGAMEYAPPRSPVTTPPGHPRPTPPVTSDRGPQSSVTEYVVQEETDKKKVTTDVVTSARVNTFEDFWQVYPRRAGKIAAKKAWDSAVGRALPADILSGALRYRDDPNRDDAYTAHPSTWLNQGRWEDDPLPGHTDRRHLTRTQENNQFLSRIDDDMENPLRVLQQRRAEQKGIAR